MQKFDEGGEGWSIIPVAILVQLPLGGGGSLYYRDRIIVQVVLWSVLMIVVLLVCLHVAKRSHQHVESIVSTRFEN